MTYGIKIVAETETKKVWYPDRQIRDKTMEELWKGCHRSDTCWRSKGIFSIRWFEDKYGWISFRKIAKFRK